MLKRLGLLLCLTGVCWGHPLDPLTAGEMQTMVEVLRKTVSPSALFPTVTLHEPPKGVADPAREGFAVVLDRKAGTVHEAVVDLKTRKVVRYSPVAGVHPGVLVEEFDSPREWVRSDKRWQEAIARRGITDYQNVQVDVWAPGLLSDEDRASGKRLLRAIAFYRPPGSRNPYARPIEGVIALIDVAAGKVLRVEDTGVIAPVNKTGNELDEKDILAEHGSLRPRVVPITCHQPSGGFVLEGNRVTWEKWDFRYSMHPREGLVLHDVRYDGRPVMYRGALCEMVVPYADPSANWSFRNAFDLGEYGVGRLANTLKLGAEVPQYAKLLDATFADDFGKPYVQKDCIGIYERDDGILWKHHDFETGHDETRRARWLHLTYVATVGNYDYALCWKLGQDASIQVQAQLTGIVLAKGVKSVTSASLDAVGDEQFGRLVDRNVVAPNHQHFFNFRLDMDVDGVENDLWESNNVAVDGAPHGNTFSRRVTPLRTEAEARRDMDFHTHRTWLVTSSRARNGLGQPTGYQLTPEENAVSYLTASAPVRRRAGFIDHHLWGTRYHPDELYAAGFYPNQNLESSGLPGWSSASQSLSGTDLVLWYTFGVTHNPRPEEWPVMPSHNTGFKLVPNGFFTRNPALDVQGQ